MYLSKEKRNIGAALVEFNRLHLHKKLSLLDTAILLDVDQDKDKSIHLYFINGFFVEKVVCARTGAVVEIIPYKNGYRVYQFLN